MKTFTYQGFDHAGRVSTGLVEALDAKEAREKLHARGILVESVRPALHPRRRFFRRTFLSAADRAMIYRELAALLKSGLPLTQALQVILETPEAGEHQVWLAAARDRVREGVSLAEALGASRSMTLFERAVVAVGERTGTLGQVMERMAVFLDEQHQMREKIQTALLYPLVVLTVAVVIALLVTGVMLPRMARLLTEARLELPTVTRVILGLGRWGTPLLGSILLGAGLAAWGIRRSLQGSPEWRREWNRRFFRWPVAGRALGALVNLRFARTLALLLEGGVPLVEAVPLAGRATGSSWTAQLAEEQAEAIRHGQNLADAVRRIPPLAGSLPLWIQAGEASGQLAPLLEHAADRYQQQWNRIMTRAMNLLEPLLVLLVGGFVLLVALGTLLPILSLNRTLQ